MKSLVLVFDDLGFVEIVNLPSLVTAWAIQWRMWKALAKLSPISKTTVRTD
jgi:hypothetical protein